MHTTSECGVNVRKWNVKSAKINVCSCSMCPNLHVHTSIQIWRLQGSRNTYEHIHTFIYLHNHEQVILRLHLNSDKCFYSCPSLHNHEQVILWLHLTSDKCFYSFFLDLPSLSISPAPWFILLHAWRNSNWPIQWMLTYYMDCALADILACHVQRVKDDVLCFTPIPITQRTGIVKKASYKD